MSFWKFCTFVGALVGGLFILGALGDTSAPRQAAAAAFAIFFVAAPYCLHGVLFRDALLERDRPPKIQEDTNSSGVTHAAYKNWSDSQP